MHIGALLVFGPRADGTGPSLDDLAAKRRFNVTVTNVRGPQQQLYVLGAPLQTVWPPVPLAAEHAIGVAIVSSA
jgi:diacylglycerol O-acyltransferase